MDEHITRFGEPRLIRLHTTDDATFYHFYGPALPAPYLAFPSGSPIYVYDEKGQFVEWVSDSGESRQFWARWGRQSGTDITIQRVLDAIAATE